MNEHRRIFPARLKPKKSLGQHFLNSPSALMRIVGAAAVKRGETVLEIGPGTGILTGALLDAGAKILAVEKDDRAFGFLKERFSAEISSGALELRHADILKTSRSSCDMDPASDGLGPPVCHTVSGRNSALNLKTGGFALVANIPYYITGAILESFLEREPRPNRMVLLVQQEVAERIVAVGGKESVLSMSVKAFGTPKLVARVPRGAFAPPPRVDSAILRIDDISDARFKESGVDIGRFFMVVKAGFSHKRKLAKRNLETVMPGGAIARAWQAAGLEEKARAEDIVPEQWFEIARLVR